jgi:hypothetical protein
MARIVLCSSPYLGMCNRFFQTAFFIAFVKTHNLKLSAPFLADYSNSFPEMNQDFFTRFASHKTWIKSKILKVSLYWLLSKIVPRAVKMSLRIPWVTFVDIGWKKQMNIEDAAFLELIKSKRIIFMMGWQFKNKIDLYQFHGSINTMFKPNKSIINRINSNFLKYKSLDSVTLGVHIRRGDYETFESGKYFYSLQQYATLMTNFSNLFDKNVLFIICSNESISFNSFKDYNHIVTKNDPVTDVYTLAKCDYILGPPSTFSMWAAFYGLKPLYTVREINYQFNLSDFKLPVLNS